MPQSPAHLPAPVPALSPSAAPLTRAAALFALSCVLPLAASAKTFVFCSEGSPENFTPALNTTGNAPFSNYSPFGRSGRFVYGRMSYLF